MGQEKEEDTTEKKALNGSFAKRLRGAVDSHHKRFWLAFGDGNVVQTRAGLPRQSKS